LRDDFQRRQAIGLVVKRRHRHGHEHRSQKINRYKILFINPRKKKISLTLRYNAPNNAPLPRHHPIPSIPLGLIKTQVSSLEQPKAPILDARNAIAHPDADGQRARVRLGLKALLLRPLFLAVLAAIGHTRHRDQLRPSLHPLAATIGSVR
jgi:hypothetical protein